MGNKIYVKLFSEIKMALSRKDVKLPENYPRHLLLEKHAEFICKYGNDPNDYEYAMSEFLRNV